MSTTIAPIPTASSTENTESRPDPLRKEPSLDGIENNSKLEIRDRETVGKELHEAFA